MTLLITSLLGGIHQRRVVNMYEVMRCSVRSIAILLDTRESHCFISSHGDDVRLRIRDQSHHRDRHRRGVRPTNCLYIVTFWLVTTCLVTP